MEDNENEKQSEGLYTDTESVDFFPDCRLSEVVAHMLESDDDGDDLFEDPYEIQTAFIDYNEEPKNKELFRGPLPSIEESDLEDAFACGNEGCGGEIEIISNQIVKIYKSPSQQENLSDDLQNKMNENEHHIKTIIGTRTETMFGVTMTSKNIESEGRLISRSETEFGAESELKDVKYRWSVTSV